LTPKTPGKSSNYCSKLTVSALPYCSPPHNKEIVNALKRRVITINRGRIVKDEEQGRYTLEGGK